MKYLLAYMCLFGCVCAEPLGLESVPWPKDNTYSARKAELGKLLFFDKRLSSDASIACATCHMVKNAYTDHLPVSIGIKGNRGTRNASTVINSAYLTTLFWDGRASSLEDQCKGPISNPKEMTLKYDPHEAYADCHQRIQAIKGYVKLFKEVFGTDECSIDDVAKAIATFERTVLSGNAPFDRYRAGDKSAMTQEQVEGMSVFTRTNCIICHSGLTMSNGKFTNIGVGMDQPNPDLGRYIITNDPEDWGAFRVPPLREIANTAPYMHDGSVKTLEEVIEYYDKGGTPNKNLHPAMYPLNLSESDKKALVKFLEALSGDGWQNIKVPEKFPQ